jgi:hypothetical protein
MTIQFDEEKEKKNLDELQKKEEEDLIQVTLQTITTSQPSESTPRRPPPPWRIFQLSPLIPPLPHHLPAPHEGPGLPPGSLATPPRQLNGKLKIAPDSSAEASSASSGPSSGVRA